MSARVMLLSFALFALGGAGVAYAGGLGEGPGSCYSATPQYCSGANTLVRMDHYQVCSAVTIACAYGCSNNQCNPGPNATTATSQSYQAPGTYAFTVPSYGTLTVQVWGAGGSGNSYGYDGIFYNGYTGGQSSFGGVVAYGGQGGSLSYNASGGAASGGDTNQTGGSSTGWNPGDLTGYGGAGASGGAGGKAGYVKCGYVACGNDAAGDGAFPGGAGGSNPSLVWAGNGSSGGGGGGYAAKTYAPGQLTPGSTVTVTVGAGGNEIFGSGNGYYWSSGFGAPGKVAITWTNSTPNAPTIGGSTTPQQGVSYAYTFSATDAAGYQIRYVIDWNNDGAIDEYAPALGYVNSGTQSSTNHAWNSLGTQTFKALTQDQYGGSSGWTSYAVTVGYPAPSVLLTASPSSITTGQSSTLTWSSAYATSCTGTNFSTGGALSGTTSVSPTQTTTYTVTCTGAGGTNSNTKTVTYTCTPQNVCSGGNVVNSCTGALVQACSYGCGGGACAAPPPPSFSSFTASDGALQSGHIQIRPALVRAGQSTKVYWSLADVASCTVSGENGDSWSGASSGTSGKTTAAILRKTVYTLSCTGLDDSSILEHATVNVAPIFQEL